MLDKHLIPFRLCFLRVAQLGGGGEGGRKVSPGYNSKIVNGVQLRKS